jgi:hypothetical protein
MALTSHPPDPSVVNSPIAVAAAVAVNPPGAGTPTGAVVFNGRSASCSGALSSGQASCALTPITAGERR